MIPPAAWPAAPNEHDAHPAGVSTVHAAPASAETPVKTRVEARVEAPAHILQVRAHPTLTLAEVAAVIGKAPGTEERAVAKLGEQRRRRVGPRKGGKWEVLA